MEKGSETRGSRWGELVGEQVGRIGRGAGGRLRVVDHHGHGDMREEGHGGMGAGAWRQCLAALWRQEGNDVFCKKNPHHFLYL